MWIVSTSDQEAMDWGRTIAEKFVSSLFARANCDNYSWTDANFAHWIETDPSVLASAGSLPVVANGEMPNFAALTGEP